MYGRSGSGKTTIIDLITGISNPQFGEVLFDGESLQNISLSSLRQNIAVVSQDSFFFNEQIANNLSYGSQEASPSKISCALQMVDLESFIRTLPDGIDTIISDEGRNLSGGQKQRLSIARAIIKNSPIIILDEPTSALDDLSANVVIENLRKMVRQQGKTIIIITHKKSLINVADHAIYIQNGKVRKQGPHLHFLTT